MVVPDDTAPRWPRLPAGRGHYESYYLRAVDRDQPRGLWIRYTVLVPPDGPPTGQLWFTLFDRTAPRPWAIRVDVGEPATGDGAWIRLGESTFGPTELVGAAAVDGRRVSWSLRHSSAEAPLRHLPRDWMYSSRQPRTKLLSPSPSALVDGEVEVDGRRIDVSGWVGMVGHNWGEEHAEEWIWLSGLGFAGTWRDTWFDVAIGRVRLGPLTSPWVANGALSVGGHRYVLGGLRRRVRVEASDDRCSVLIPGPRGIVVGATASAPPEAFVEWDYASPDGAVSRVLNCSVADLALSLDRPGAQTVELLADGSAAYELGRRAPSS
ncbi:hypothetical protein ACI78T_10055 [Blastococcus sp. SYSU D00922]